MNEEEILQLLSALAQGGTEAAPQMPVPAQTPSTVLSQSLGGKGVEPMLLKMAMAGSGDPDMVRMGAAMASDEETNKYKMLGGRSIVDAQGNIITDPSFVQNRNQQAIIDVIKSMIPAGAGLKREDMGNNNAMALAMLNNSEAMKRLIASLTNKTDLEGMRGRNRIDVEKVKALLKGANAPGAKMTASEKKDFITMGEQLENIRGLATDFKDEYASQFGVEEGLKRVLSNTVGEYAPQTAQDSNNWWNKWELLYTFPERHKIFGATLTGNEKADWERNKLRPGLGHKEVRRRIEWYQNKIQSWIDNAAAGKLAEGVNPDVLSGYTGFDDVSALGKSSAAAMAGVSAKAAARQKELDDVFAGSDVAVGGGEPEDEEVSLEQFKAHLKDMTDEELMELAKDEP